MEEKAGTDFMKSVLRSMEAQAIRNGDTQKLANLRAAIQSNQREAKEFTDFMAHFAPQSAASSARPTVLQGDTRGLTQRGGLHNPTMAEILADASRPDPTALYFDTSSDHMAVIDPLAPHTIYSGEGVKTVNPFKPGPKFSGPA